jgi:hypothetical protein
MENNLSIKKLSSINGGKKNGVVCNAAMWGLGGLGAIAGSASGGFASFGGAALGAYVGHNIAC